MKFKVFGPFEVPRDGKLVAEGKGQLNEFWEKKVDKKEEGLTDACGCYVFVISGGKGGVLPWYVGMTGKQTFKGECFMPHKVNIYNNAMNARAGKPHLFLIPKMTPTDNFVRPTKGKSKDIQFLEDYLMSLGLNRNDKIKNGKGTKYLRKIIVPGILNTGQGQTTKDAQKLKKVFGLK